MSLCLDNLVLIHVHAVPSTNRLAHSPSCLLPRLQPQLQLILRFDATDRMYLDYKSTKTAATQVNRQPALLLLPLRFKSTHPVISSPTLLQLNHLLTSSISTSSPTGIINMVTVPTLMLFRSIRLQSSSPRASFRPCTESL